MREATASCERRSDSRYKTDDGESSASRFRLIVTEASARSVAAASARAGAGALSPREREVLRLLTTGATNREISERLGIGAETVKTLLSRSYTKLGVSRRAGGVAAAPGRGSY